MRLTQSFVRVAAEFVRAPDIDHWGYRLVRNANQTSAVVYPMLAKMVALHWVSEFREDPATITESRPPRRYYRLTELGRDELVGKLRAAQADPRFASVGLEWL
ncbi:PadR family transcriptional regulator [Nocardia suismassiliense]|uniref:PadR family transcriptional regulator n=1 Tax=Nocardia suismassiliense TaxID=2077092 RepID=UPI00131F0AA5|nr:helix-turn-helix transcriptional regulator [Nocardia suismassiliense]